MLSATLGVNIFECFGFTETAGPIFCTLKGDIRDGHLGCILPNFKLQLRNPIDFDGCRLGQLFAKGSSVFKGYYKYHDHKISPLDSDEWIDLNTLILLKTDGRMQVLEREYLNKSLKDGRPIEPTLLEGIYLECPLVNQIYIDVSQSVNFLVALLYLNEDKLCELADVHAMEGEFEDLIELPELEQIVIQQLEKIAVRHRLTQIQRIRRAQFVTEPLYTEEKNELESIIQRVTL